MSSWITRLDATGAVRVAVKDAIDVEGVPTTVGCAAVADRAGAAASDAPCVASIRAGGGAIVGKTNLHELCFGTAGTNPWFGNPVNPLAPELVPGGSSSGSAVAVAVGEADIGIGTDTGGSVRVPAACCGIVGLKTTWARISTEGVWPLSPTLDTVGPLARDVAGIVAGMALLDPSFVTALAPARVIGRVRVQGVDADRAIDADIDAALRDFEVVDLELPGLATIGEAFTTIILTEAWESDRHLFDTPDRIGDQVRTRLEQSSAWPTSGIPAALEAQRAWQEELRSVFERVELLAMPTLVMDPPAVGAEGVDNRHVYPWNVAGTPAISLPVGARRPIPSSLQLVGPWGREDLLCATAAVVAGE